MLDFYTGSQGTEFIYSLIFGECYSRFMKPELIKILQFPQKEFYTLKLSVVHWFVNKGKNESLERPRESMAKYGDEMTTYCFRLWQLYSNAFYSTDLFGNLRHYPSKS